MIDKICADFYEKGLAVYDHFISDKEVDLLLEMIAKHHHLLQSAGIGNKANFQVKPIIRGDFIEWLDPLIETQFASIYLKKLAPIIAAFNQRFFLSIVKSDHQIAFYPPHSHYEKHVDTFQKNDSRVVSSVLYLNKNWQINDGGELCVYLKNKTVQKVEPIAGRLVLFESILEHEVLECNAPRYSIAGWFKRNA